MVLVLVTCASFAVTTSAVAAPDLPEQFTPIVMSVMSDPSWFRGTDGRVHLVYELEMLNAFPVATTVTSVEVRDRASGRSLVTLAGDGLMASMSLLTGGAVPTTTLEPSVSGVVWFDIPLDAARDLPAALEHVVTIAVAPGVPVPDTIVERGAVAKIDRHPPLVVGPPLRGPGWLAAGSCCDGPHRRSAQPVDGKLWLGQRFAIDFNRLDDQDFLATGDPSVTTSWPTYGQPVLAVADATVVSAVDRYDDQIPGAPKPVTIDEADGNSVILDLGRHTFALYAHLRPGTVAVKDGQQVKTGDVIAQSGNSGSSGGPHLHFQLMDRPSALKSNGLPFVFARFVLEGESPPLDELLSIDPVATPVPISRTTVGPRRDELPLGADLVAFAGKGRP